VSGGSAPRHIDEKTALKEGPHMVRSVDLFDFHFSVNVAVIEEIDVNFLHFGDAVFMRDHLDDVV